MHLLDIVEGELDRRLLLLSLARAALLLLLAIARRRALWHQVDHTRSLVRNLVAARAAQFVQREHFRWCEAVFAP